MIVWLAALSVLALVLAFHVSRDAARIDRHEISIDLALEAMEAVLDHEEAERQELIKRIREGRRS